MDGVGLGKEAREADWETFGAECTSSCNLHRSKSFILYGLKKKKSR